MKRKKKRICNRHLIKYNDNPMHIVRVNTVLMQLKCLLLTFGLPQLMLNLFSVVFGLLLNKFKFQPKE